MSAKHKRDVGHIRYFINRRNTKISRNTRKRNDANNSRIPKTAEMPTTE
jgi:hypothetical protein